MSKVAERRAELRDVLVALAEAQIERGGLGSLKARDLAREAGCAVGAIYNVFADMTALAMAVNGRTFTRLGAAVAGAVQGHQDQPPERRLVLLASAYLDFADRHQTLWRALFDLRLTEGDVPDWYMAELRILFGHIAGPVAELFPRLEGRELELMVRALFSSVHGIVLLGLENRISGVPRENIRSMIEAVLLRVTGRDVTSLNTVHEIS
jgi:AcrR family transcriptional regulator